LGEGFALTGANNFLMTDWHKLSTTSENKEIQKFKNSKNGILIK
jgi:hypothetical protein